MNTVDIVTIFPAMVEAVLNVGVVGRAREQGAVEIRVRDLRDFTTDRHRVVDDVPYGGGPGMVLKPEPIFRALEVMRRERGEPLTVVLTSPQGQAFTQQVAERFARERHLVIVCGRYEGVDERVREQVTEEVSIGDYVLTGGELPALVIVDAVARLLPGVVGDEQSVAEESFSRGLLDFPQYTRPSAVRIGSTDDGDRELTVPDVLLSGNHAQIRRWRKREALTRTLARRPELLASARLDEEERHILAELQKGEKS